MIAFVLSGPDNDSQMFRDSDIERCAQCGFVLDQNYVSPNLKITRRRYDFGFTYDNVPIVSRRLADFCSGMQTPGLELVPLPADQDFFVFRPVTLVPFDADRRKSRFENLCAACERFEAVVGATPAFLSIESLPSSEGFFRTDLEFGSGDERQPLVLAAPSTVAKLRSKSFSGIEFAEVEGL